MKILYLYYDLMNLYGENGNPKVLKKHLEDQGFEVTLDRKTIGEKIDFSEYDFIYSGAGTERNQKVALLDLQKRKEEFKEAIEKGVPMLFTGNSFEMIGKSILGIDGKEYEGLGLMDFETKENPKVRYNNDVVFLDEDSKELIGFINRSGSCYGIEEKDSMFKVLFGEGHNSESQFEGVKLNNFMGTYLTGPVLVKNPPLMKKVVEQIGKRAKDDFELKEVEYPYEEKSYEVTLNALIKRYQK